MNVVEVNVNPKRVKHDLKKQERSLLLRRFLSNKLMVTGSIIIVLLLLLAILGPKLTPFDPYEMVVKERLEAPSSHHLLGTDNFGRDLLTRIIYGAKVSMWVGFASALLSSIIGLAIGLTASYYRYLDNILMRICDGLLAFPAILFAIALMAVLGAKTENVIIALTIVFSPEVARIVRSRALVVREETYIEAIRSQGASAARIIWKHIAPNTISPLLVKATFVFSEAVIVEATLSFLGAGVPAPDPSWGNILSDGKDVIYTAWWMTVFPGLFIILSVLGLNLLGDGLRDLIDPQSSTK
ncbi:ABC transporter permease [Neobacillus dielmonensis]|uniref:ABC transporter permease n=1 Tax=Neobacillus dielmonensis TaxID=1347369 RepID=UPI0005AA9F56|nr:ABC transporter permease [Neobacillus dielmonensis]